MLCQAVHLLQPAFPKFRIFVRAKTYHPEARYEPFFIDVAKQEGDGSLTVDAGGSVVVKVELNSATTTVSARPILTVGDGSSNGSQVHVPYDLNYDLTYTVGNSRNRNPIGHRRRRSCGRAVFRQRPALIGSRATLSASALIDVADLYEAAGGFPANSGPGLTVSGATKVTDGGKFVIYSSYGSTARATITGAGASLSVSGAVDIGVGEDSTLADMEIENGAALSVKGSLNLFTFFANVSFEVAEAAPRP